jgi:hypothetical protein
VLTALGAAVAVAAVWLVGHALLRGRLPGGLGSVEIHAAKLVTGLGALSLAAVALADLRLHAPWSMATVTVVLIAVGLGCNPADITRPVRARTRTDLALVAAAVATIALALPGFEWSLGGRDAGTYVNEVVQIQERGSVEISEPSLDSLPANIRRALPLGGRYPGEYFGDQPGEIVRLGFHTWPALRAAAGYASGDEGVWSLPVIAGLALLLTALAARRLAPEHGDAAALATAGLLITSVAFHWYARFPMTEIPALALLSGGVWLWAVAAPARAAYTAGVAGFLLGLTFLMRPDGLFTVGAVALLAAWLLATGRLDRAARALVLATIATAAITFAHVGRYSWTYFAGNWDRHAHAVAVAAPIAALAVAAGTLVAARRRAAVDGVLQRHEATIARALAIVAGGGLALLIVAGRLLDWNGATWLTWYATWPGLVLAVGGLSVTVVAAFRSDRGTVLLLPVALLLGTVAIYGVDARVAPDHFWAVRRLVSAALPLLAVFAGLAVAAAWSRPRLRAGVLALLAVTLVLEARDLWPALRFDEYRGSTAALASLDAKLGEPETLVITPWLRAPDGRYGVPLRVRFHRPTVPVFRLDRQPLAGWVTDQVARRPVRLVTFFGRVPPLAPGLRAVREAAVTIDLAEFDQTVDQIPTGGHRLRMPLVVYRLEATG